MTGRTPLEGRNRRAIGTLVDSDRPAAKTRRIGNRSALCRLQARHSGEVAVASHADRCRTETVSNLHRSRRTGEDRERKAPRGPSLHSAR